MNTFKGISFLFYVWQTFGVFWIQLKSPQSLLKVSVKLFWFAILASYSAYVFLDGIVESYRYARTAKLNIFTYSDLLTMNMYRLLSLITIVEMFLKRNTPIRIISILNKIDSMLCGKFYVKVESIQQRKKALLISFKWFVVFMCTEGVALSLLRIHSESPNYFLYLKFFTIPFLFSGIFYFEFYCFVFFIKHRVEIFYKLFRKSFVEHTIPMRSQKHPNFDHILVHLWEFYDDLWRLIESVNHLFAISLSVNLSTSFFNLLSICYYAFNHVLASKSESTTLMASILFSLLAIYSCFCVFSVVNMCQRFNDQVCFSSGSLAISRILISALLAGEVRGVDYGNRLNIR